MGIRDWLWHQGEQGRAWRAYESGATRYATTLDVTDGGFQQTVSAIEDAGWCLASRDDHDPIRITEVNPRSDGSHEVVKTVQKKATFFFTRAASARIASVMAAEVEPAQTARRQRRARAPRRAGGERSADDRRKIHEYLAARPHRYRYRYRALAATLLMALGLILLIVFFTYRHKTVESGHLWWKKTRTVDVTAADKLPLLLVALVLMGVGAFLGWSAFRHMRLQNSNIAAVAGAKDVRRKRTAARALATRDPSMARELRIGRPDLRREYDDGGLVDINNAPVEALIAWLGLDRSDADEIVAKRTHFGGFEHEAEIETIGGVDSRTFVKIRDRIILL